MWPEKGRIVLANLQVLGMFWSLFCFIITFLRALILDNICLLNNAKDKLLPSIVLFILLTVTVGLDFMRYMAGRAQSISFFVFFMFAVGQNSSFKARLDYITWLSILFFLSLNGKSPKNIRLWEKPLCHGQRPFSHQSEILKNKKK